MKVLEQVRQQLTSGQFEFTRHAFKRAIERNISELEIREIGNNVKIIEEYPDDKYSPSCLLLGFTQNKRPLHLQVSVEDSEILKIITIYEPDEERWTGFEKRR
ncbi:MAG: DUF4258 domain-containing protein [Nitrospiraceae bacterium]|nr:MAG: DUF4258 domain-containing protein [Nitrospiraceae bacterium]